MHFQMQSYVESGLQLFGRLTKRPKVDNLDTTIFADLKNGDTTEIVGNVSSGKTYLLTHLMANCLLNCEDAAIILIDLDHDFRIPLLFEMMKKQTQKLDKSKQNKEEDNFDSIKKMIKDRVTIINCYDGFEFRLCLMSLENKILQNNKVALVMIDGLTAFYWQDRDQDNAWMKDLYLKQLLCSVQNYTTLTHKVNLVYTVPIEYMPVSTSYSAWSSCEHLDHRINLVRTTCGSYAAVRSRRTDQEKILKYQITKSCFSFI